MISCTSPWRRAYGWQRHGGMADYILAEEKDLVAPARRAYVLRRRPGGLRFRDRLRRHREGGRSRQRRRPHHRSGPGRLATAMLCRAMGARQIIGIDVLPERLRARPALESVSTRCFSSGPDNVAEVRQLHRRRTAWSARSTARRTTDARLTCIQATRKWGRIFFLGEGGTRRSSGPRRTSSTIRRPSTARGSPTSGEWKNWWSDSSAGTFTPSGSITHRFPLEQGGRGVRADGERPLRQGGRGI